MATNVTDNRIVISDAETATGWTGGGTATTPNIQGTAAYVGTLNIATGQFYFTTGSGQNLNNTLIYVWSNNFALQDVWTAANPPNAMHIGDGTNRISFKIAGSDRKVFTHLENSDWNWDCLVLDTAKMSELNTNGFTVARAGSFAALNTGSLTQFGVDFTTLSKGLGGGTNVAVDIMRYGNNGISIWSGSVSDPATFLETVVLDRTVTGNRAHGIIREYTAGLYGLQGPITFGNGTNQTYFSDANRTLVFEDRDIANDKYYIKTTGSVAQTTEVFLDAINISTAGPWVRMDFSSDNVASLEITNCTISGLSGSVSFATGLTASAHLIDSNNFTRPGVITIGDVQFTNNTVAQGQRIIANGSGSLVGTAIRASLVVQGTGSLFYNSTLNPDSYLTGMEFITGSITNHGIEFGSSTPATMSLTDVIFSGYGADDTSGSAIFNNSGGSRQLTISGVGTIPTIRNGPGASTTLITGIRTLTLEDIVSGSEVALVDTAGTLLDNLETVAADGLYTYTYAYTTDQDIFAYIHKEDYVWLSVPITLRNQNQTITIQQSFDRNYSNP